VQKKAELLRKTFSTFFGEIIFSKNEKKLFRARPVAFLRKIFFFKNGNGNTLFFFANKSV
jgi:hypothetical protein